MSLRVPASGECRHHAMSSPIRGRCHEGLRCMREDTHAPSARVCTDTSVTQIWLADASGQTRRSDYVVPLRRVQLTCWFDWTNLNTRGPYTSTRWRCTKAPLHQCCKIPKHLTAITEGPSTCDRAICVSPGKLSRPCLGSQLSSSLNNSTFLRQ
jgi:hypothetical protein